MLLCIGLTVEIDGSIAYVGCCAADLPYYILHGYAWLFLATKLGVIANMF